MNESVDEYELRLRDEFATAALPTILQLPAFEFQKRGPDSKVVDALACGCYNIADAMLRARKATKK